MIHQQKLLHLGSAIQRVKSDSAGKIRRNVKKTNPPDNRKIVGRIWDLL